MRLQLKDILNPCGAYVKRISVPFAYTSFEQKMEYDFNAGLFHIISNASYLATVQNRITGEIVSKRLNTGSIEGQTHGFFNISSVDEQALGNVYMIFRKAKKGGYWLEYYQGTWIIYKSATWTK